MKTIRFLALSLVLLAGAMTAPRANAIVVFTDTNLASYLGYYELAFDFNYNYTASTNGSVDTYTFDQDATSVNSGFLMLAFSYLKAFYAANAAYTSINDFSLIYNSGLVPQDEGASYTGLSAVYASSVEADFFNENAAAFFSGGSFSYTYADGPISLTSGETVLAAYASGSIDQIPSTSDESTAASEALASALSIFPDETLAAPIGTLDVVDDYVDAINEAFEDQTAFNIDGGIIEYGDANGTTRYFITVQDELAAANFTNGTNFFNAGQVNAGYAATYQGYADFYALYAGYYFQAYDTPDIILSQGYSYYAYFAAFAKYYNDSAAYYRFLNAYGRPPGVEDVEYLNGQSVGL